MNKKVVFNTDGTGRWSSKSAPVTITGLSLYTCLDEEEINEDTIGNLCVDFDINTWDTNKDGLIYTDQLFLEEVINFLDKIGLSSSKDIDYTEQGMQGDEFVSLEVPPKFSIQWKERGLPFNVLIDIGQFV